MNPEVLSADPGLFAYLARVSIALAVLSLGAFFVVRRSKKWRGTGGGADVKLLASLPLGKDVFFVVRCGPDVLAFVSGAGGARLMGRWKYEDWASNSNSSSGSSARSSAANAASTGEVA